MQQSLQPKLSRLRYAIHYNSVFGVNVFAISPTKLGHSDEIWHSFLNKFAAKPSYFFHLT